MRRKDTVSSRDLIKLQRLKGQTQAHFISTDKGVLVGTEASKQHVGGIPLFCIG